MDTTSLNENGFAINDGNITIYNYLVDTHEYISTSSVYLMKGIGIPANSTLTSPPDAKDGYARVFNTSWEYVEDHRGTVVYDSTGQELKITSLGPIDSQYSTTKPAPKPIPLTTQASDMQYWINQQANLASAMGESFTSDMKAYVKAINAIINGTDTTSTTLPTQPTDIME